jgi:hypothetical protein
MRSRIFGEPFLGDMALDIARYVCKMAVAGVPDGSCKASNILGVIGELDDDGPPISKDWPKADTALTTFNRCWSSLDMAPGDNP